MDLDINVGDVVLGGKFKNKRIVVKKIGTDELGQPIINKSRKLLAVRIEKKLPEGMWSTKSLAEKYNDKDMDKKAFLKDIYNLSFKDELEKISSNAATRAFRRGNLSEKSLKKVVDYTKKTIGLKHLGTGSFQNSMLVIDPKFGKSVQKKLINPSKIIKGNKIVNIINFKPEKYLLKKRDDEFKALRHLNILMRDKKDIQIAKIKGRRGTTFFQEYSKSTPKEIYEDKFRLKRLSNAHKKRDLVNRVTWNHKTKKPILNENFYEELEKANNEYYKAKNAFNEYPKLNKQTTNVLNKFKKKYPKTWDIRVGNISGGKIIDFEVGNKVKHFINI